jgi:putative membrane protein
MKRFLLIAACLLVAGPASAQSAAEKTGVNSTLGVSPTTPDFVKQAAISDMFEIESSKLAADQTGGAAKIFANQMVQDHAKTSTELKGMAPTDAPIPTALDSSHQSKLDKLKGLKGADFTKQYNDMQVSAHKDAVSLFERYGKGGDNAKLKDWASKTLPALKHHLEMAQALNK